MVGRAAYHQPADILCRADRMIWGQGEDSDPVAVVRQMQDYIADHVAQGGRLHQVTRHMLGLFAGTPGARQWRRILSEGASRDGADFALVRQALDAVLEARAQAVA
jgi:tRNA-dihydrouridine synthase A